MKKSIFLKIKAIAIPIFTIAFVIIIKKYLNNIFFLFLPCPFNQLTGKLCPACGNTRSVIALMQGDIITSLGYNITPAVICILLILLYIEYFIKAFWKFKKILPRSNVFWIIFIVAMFIYYIVRNFLPFPLF